MNNKNKLFLLLAVVFCLIPFQSSWGAYGPFGSAYGPYYDTNTYCAGDGVLSGSSQLSELPPNQYCIFDKNNFPGWNKSAQIGLSIDQIRVPYKAASVVWGAIQDNLTPNRDSLVTIPGLGSVVDCQKDHGEGYFTYKSEVGGDGRHLNSSHDERYNPIGDEDNLINFYRLHASNIPSYFSVPIIYDKVKTAITKSCLPGAISTSKTVDSKKFMCWISYHTPPRDVYGIFYPKNYQFWSSPGCPSLESSMTLTVTGISNTTGRKDLAGNSRQEVAPGGSFTLTWGSSNWDILLDYATAKCTISGDNPTTEAKDDINSITSFGSPYPFYSVKTGIYPYTLTCQGVLDGAETSSEFGEKTKTVTVYTSDVPVSPTVTSFASDLTLITAATAGASAVYKIIKGDKFTLSWDVNTSADSIKIYRTAGFEYTSSGARDITSSANRDIDTGGLAAGNYTFTIVASNIDYPYNSVSDPGLGKDTKSVVINITAPAVPTINNFDFVTPNNDLVQTKSPAQIAQGKNFKLKWDVTNSDSITISGTDISAASTPTGDVTIDTNDLTIGQHTLTLTARRTKYPNLAPTIQSRKINVTAPGSPTITSFDFDILAGLGDLANISANTVPASNLKYRVPTGGKIKLGWLVTNTDSVTIYGTKGATYASGNTTKITPTPITDKTITNLEIDTSALTTLITEPGLWTFTLEAKNTSCIGSSCSNLKPATKDVLIYVGAPDFPTINNFDFVTPNSDFTDVPGANSTTIKQIPINKSFALEWDVNASANSITINRKKGAVTTSVSLTDADKRNKTTAINTSKLTTGLWTFTITAGNTAYPQFKPTTKDIFIIVGNVTAVDSPIIQFSADKTEIGKNEKATLTWNVSGAANISINHGIGKVLAGGSADVYPSITTTYALTATSPITSISPVQKTVTIKIKTSATPTPPEPFILPTPPPSAPLPEQEDKPTEKETIDLKVNNIDGPITLNAPATFTLSWNLDKYCLATGSWLGIKLKAGTQSVTLNKNGKYTYSLYCPGYGTDSAVINVVGSSDTGLLDSILGNTSKEPMPVAEASISSDRINYSQNLKVIRGEPVDIYVKADKDINNDGKISRDATGQWTELLSNGGYCLYNASLQKNPPKFDSAVNNPESPESCNVFLGNFTFNDEPGTYKYGLFELLQNDNKFSDISYVNIAVENPPLPDTAPVIDLRINGDDKAEQVLGTPAGYNVTWDAVNADSCEASGSWSNARELKGIQSFVSSVKKDFTYTLTCIGKLGTTTKSIILKIVESPVCAFTALPPTINKQSAFITESELSWKCDYADSCSLSPNISEQIKTYGSMRVSPDQTTTYSLDCQNSSVSKSFEATVTVE